MEYKPKRYIIEMCNDFIKHYANSGKSEKARKLDNIRNSYIIGIITEIDVIKSIIADEEK